MGIIIIIIITREDDLYTSYTVTRRSLYHTATKFPTTVIKQTVTVIITTFFF